MPAYSTHYIFAKELLPFLKETAGADINEAAVMYGTQGPDIFFFHRVFPFMPGKTLRKVGSALHLAKPEITFSEMRAYCERVDSPIAWSYAYGFMLHYALDRKFHPYVYAFQKRLLDAGEYKNRHSAHNAIEYELDVYFLNKRYNIAKPYAFKTAATLSRDEEVIGGIARLLAEVVPKITGDEVSYEDCRLALLDMIYVQRSLRDTVGFTRAFAYCLDRAIDKRTNGFKFSVMIRTKDLEKAKKCANIDKSLWQSPYEEGDRYESADELFDIAKDEAKELLIGFIAGRDCYEITQNKSFSTGVEIV